MLQAIQKWYASHTITTHSLMAAAALFATLYAAVPAFQSLMNSWYAAMPPGLHAIAAAVIGIVGYYLVANKKPTPPVT